jgi:hypothetical protein
MPFLRQLLNVKCDHLLRQARDTHQRKVIKDGVSADDES